jgi:hypothetical protein
MNQNPITQQDADKLLQAIIEGWKGEVDVNRRSELEPIKSAHPFIDVYDAAVSLIDHTGNLAYSVDLLKAILEQAVKEGHALDWIASEVWFEMRASGARSRQATALADLKRDQSLDDKALDNYNGRIGRAIKPS